MATNQPHTKRDVGGQGAKADPKPSGGSTKSSPGKSSAAGQDRGGKGGKSGGKGGGKG